MDGPGFCGLKSKTLGLVRFGFGRNFRFGLYYPQVISFLWRSSVGQLHFRGRKSMYICYPLVGRQAQPLLINRSTNNVNVENFPINKRYHIPWGFLSFWTMDLSFEIKFHATVIYILYTTRPWVLKNHSHTTIVHLNRRLISENCDEERYSVLVWSVITTALSLVGNSVVLVASIKYDAIAIDSISKVRSFIF